MANDICDTGLFDRAAVFSINAHAGTGRKGGKGYPYILHCMEAATIVASFTADQEMLAAAILHDTIEDTDVSYRDIQREFGDRVADLVLGESSFKPAGASPGRAWRARREIVIERLSTASREEKIIALGDKLSNMRAIARDFDELGNELWKRFSCDDPTDYEWYYRSLAGALSELKGSDAYDEFERLVNYVFDRAFPK